MPRWVLPLAILVPLILAFAFRWEEGPRKTFNNIAVVSMQDRWTGQHWVKTYEFGIDSVSIKEKPAQIPYSPPKKPAGMNEGFAIFDNEKSKTPSLDALASTPKEQLEEYKTEKKQYQKNVSNYISVQFAIRRSLTIIWCIFTLLTLVWLYLSIKNQAEGDTHD